MPQIKKCSDRCIKKLSSRTFSEFSIQPMDRRGHREVSLPTRAVLVEARKHVSRWVRKKWIIRVIIEGVPYSCTFVYYSRLERNMRLPVFRDVNLSYIQFFLPFPFINSFFCSIVLLRIYNLFLSFPCLSYIQPSPFPFHLLLSCPFILPLPLHPK